MASNPTTDNGQDHTNSINTIAKQTARQVSIESRPTPSNIARCNGQAQSPLFGTLPPEIRNHIFSLALRQYEDSSQPYVEHDYCYRPGHRARHVVNANLLQTCRRVWLEANHWTMAQAIHTFWFDGERRPDWATRRWNSEDQRIIDFFKSLTTLQRSRVKHIHVLAQMWWLEYDIVNSTLWKNLTRERLDLDSFTVTIRHSDWWSWESDEPLRFERRWIRQLLASPGASRVSEFRLELETLEWKVDQLRRIIEQLRLVGEAKEGGVARWELVEPFEEATWSGPVNLGGEDEYRYIYDGRIKLDYRVTTMKWRLRVGAANDVEQRWREEGSLLRLCEPLNDEGDIYDEGDRSSSEDDMSEDEIYGVEDFD